MRSPLVLFNRFSFIGLMLVVGLCASGLQAAEKNTAGSAKKIVEITGEVHRVFTLDGKTIFSLHEHAIWIQINKKTVFVYPKGRPVSIFSAESLLPRKGVKVQVTTSEEGSFVALRIYVMNSEEYAVFRPTRPKAIETFKVLVKDSDPKNSIR